jgi:hypothetical protein
VSRADRGAVSTEHSKQILCIVPDDGTERRLLNALRKETGISGANSVCCRGISILQETRAQPGKLLEAALARLVTVVVDTDTADRLFEFICERADIGRPGGGASS